MKCASDFMTDNLQDLQRKVAMKPHLEDKLHELHQQRRQYGDHVISLRVAFRKEQKDVEKLTGRSLANYFYQVIDKMDDKLDQERKEAYAAKVKLDTAERELAGIESDIKAIQAKIAKVLVAEARYQKSLEAKRMQLKVSDTEIADQILALEEIIAALQVQKQEIREAISAGYNARGTAERILSELENADSWNTWDIVDVGGLYTHMVKYRHLDEAQNLVQELQSQLRRFKTELIDIQISANMQVSIDGFLRFADHFTDDLFADWAVAIKIRKSMSSVSDTRSQINHMLDRLSDMEKSADQKIEETRKKLEQLVLNA